MSKSGPEYQKVYPTHRKRTHMRMFQVHGSVVYHYATVRVQEVTEVVRDRLTEITNKVTIVLEVLIALHRLSQLSACCRSLGQIPVAPSFNEYSITSIRETFAAVTIVCKLFYKNEAVLP